MLLLRAAISAAAATAAATIATTVKRMTKCERHDQQKQRDTKRVRSVCERVRETETRSAIYRNIRTELRYQKISN